MPVNVEIIGMASTDCKNFEKQKKERSHLSKTSLREETPRQVKLSKPKLESIMKLLHSLASNWKFWRSVFLFLALLVVLPCREHSKKSRKRQMQHDGNSLMAEDCHKLLHAVIFVFYPFLFPPFSCSDVEM